MQKHYIRLPRAADWRCRAQFFGVAAQAMRRILVDHARRHGARKRGGSWDRITLDETRQAWPAERDVDVVALEVLGVSPSMVSREWRLARAWLLQRLRGATGKAPRART